MSAPVPEPNVYEKCKHFTRTLPSSEIDEETTNKISKNFRVLPFFEKEVFERKFINHYSLRRNDLLKCRWRMFKDRHGERSGPFQFPSNRDLHFYKNEIRYKPNQTLIRWKDYNMKLALGPGFDQFGPMPAPQEVFMKRL